MGKTYLPFFEGEMSLAEDIRIAESNLSMDNITMHGGSSAGMLFHALLVITLCYPGPTSPPLRCGEMFLISCFAVYQSYSRASQNTFRKERVG